MRRHRTYRAAVRELDALLDAPERRRDDDRLAFLSLLVEGFEERTIAPDDARGSPQETVDFMLEQRGMRRGDLARFYGIVIRMFHRAHEPAHLHALYGEHEITVEILSGAVVGQFPPVALRLAQTWVTQHRTELLHCWSLARAGKQLPRIAPLE